MGIESCYWGVCWVPLAKDGYVKIFGFAEFLAALALLAVLFTISDVRYKFRTAIVPGNLYLTTFAVMLLVGAQALMSEVWIALGWYVPVTSGLTAVTWQALFGSLFLVTFATWMYYAFIRPPIFARRNAERYAQTLFAYVLKANDDELKVLSHEIGRSAEAIVRFSRPTIDSTVIDSFDVGNQRSQRDPKKMPAPRAYALDLHYLIANRKLCRNIVESSPVTIIRFLDAANADTTRSSPIGQFAENISIEAFSNRNSFIYTEERHYDAGLIGRLKPVTQALYGRFSLIESMAQRGPFPFDIPYDDQIRWGGDEWEAYCRLALLLFEDYAKSKHGRSRSQALSCIFESVSVKHSFGSYQGEQVHQSTEYRRLRASVEFIKGAIRLLDKHGGPPDQRRPTESYRRESIYDDLAHLMFDACVHASRVERKDLTGWDIQHNVVWTEFFAFDDSTTWSIVRKRLCHLLAKEVCEVATLPHFANVPLLGYCANVMGLSLGPKNSRRDRETRALHRLVLWLIRKHYAKLVAKQTRLAESMLVGKLSFDALRFRVIKTYEANLSDVAPTEGLDLEGAFTKVEVRRLKKRR